MPTHLGFLLWLPPTVASFLFLFLTKLWRFLQNSICMQNTCPHPTPPHHHHTQKPEDMVSLFNIYLFIWLYCILVTAHAILDLCCRIFSCGIWDSVPCPGISPLHWKLRVLATGPLRKTQTKRFEVTSI